MLDPRTSITGRTTLFVEIEVRDHELGTWSAWQSGQGRPGVDPDVLVQRAMAAGFDDVRARAHNTGPLDNPNLIVP